MKKLFFILTNIILFGVCAAKAQVPNAATMPVNELPAEMQKKCSEITADPQFNFTSSYGTLKYDFGKTEKEVTAISKQYGILEQGLFASGLALISVEWEVSLNSVSRIIEGTDICVIPMELNIFIGYKDPIIYVSKDLRPNSCEYNLVIRHEQTHQQINKTALDFFIPILRDSIGKIAKDIKPLHVDKISQIDAATDTLTREYTDRIQPLINIFKYELLQEQAKLDNHDNYKMENDVCKNFNRSH